MENVQTISEAQWASLKNFKPERTLNLPELAMIYSKGATQLSSECRECGRTFKYGDHAECLRQKYGI